MNNFMVSMFGASWKSALIGYLAALATLLYPIFSEGRYPTLKELIIAAFMALFGYLVKDKDVTGGKRQTTVAEDTPKEVKKLE
jgi:hypothetical protein